jgi:hypothetical protein
MVKLLMEDAEVLWRSIREGIVEVTDLCIPE